MAKMTHDELKHALQPHLLPGEEVRHLAFGVKQPPIAVIILLVLIAVLPGLIAVLLLTRNYLVALTDRRLLVLRVSGPFKPEAKEMIEFDLDRISRIKTRRSPIFVHLNLQQEQQRFVAKFHRSPYRGANRTESIAIVDELQSVAATLPAQAAA